MNRLAALHEVTKQLDKVLKQRVDSKNRDEVIQQINELIEQRGSYLEDLKAPYTEEEKIIGREVINLNNQIEKKMELLFSSLKQEMQQSKKQKSTTKSYTDPYGDMNTVDGMFLDNKL